jgi:hypothetical protein
METAFDLWHARHIARQMENRSGDFLRSMRREPLSWGECQDLNASRLKVLSRISHGTKNPDWSATILKCRLQIDMRGKKQKILWYDQEYRMTFQINKRAYESAAKPVSPIWEARATYEVAECNLRARTFKYGKSAKILHTWPEACFRAHASMQRHRPNHEAYQGRHCNNWELVFRHANLKFSHVPPIEDSWFRSVKSKLVRLISAEIPEEKLSVKKYLKGSTLNG